MTEDNLKTARLYEEVEKKFSELVGACKTVVDYEKYL